MLEKLKYFLGGDYTPLEHVLYATVVQGCVFIILDFFLGSLTAITAGTAAAIGVFFGREDAQAEAKLRPYMGEEAVHHAMLFWKWDWPSQMDLYAPAVVCSAIWLFGLLVL